MKNKTLRHSTGIKSLLKVISGVCFILLFLIGCNSVQTEKSVENVDTLTAGIKAANYQQLFAFKFPKSAFESNWATFKNEKKVLFQYQFDPALGSANFKLLAFITNHVKYGDSCIPFTLNPTGNGVLKNTTDLILGNLDLNWHTIVQLIKKGNDIDPDFDHIYLEPDIKSNYLFYHVTLRKANGSEFKPFPVISPANSTLTVNWEFFDANPSPPAKSN